MASAFTHAAAALALGTAFSRPGGPARFWALGALCAALPDVDVVAFRALPDVDVVAFRFGVPYAHVLGHRGLTHSLLFAALLAAAVVATAFRGAEWRGARGQLWTFFFLATASHGVLDAMTSGGRGGAFFAPLDDTRYFLPWRPILVSPIGVRRFFQGRGLAVLASELRWVWLPAGAFAMCALALRARVARSRA